jgi:hypothetical protein
MHFLGKKTLLCAYMGHFHAMNTAKELDNLMNVNFIKNKVFFENVGYHFFCNFNAILEKLFTVDFFRKKTEKEKNYESTLDFFRLYKSFPHLSRYVQNLAHQIIFIILKRNLSW